MSSTSYDKILRTVDFVPVTKVFADHSRDCKLDRLGEQLTSFKRLEADAKRKGVNVYPLGIDDFLIVTYDGLTHRAADMRAASIFVRRLGGIHHG
ncbi:hypothetical protein [Rhodoferax sp.]|uniref:hypothetical protein n=1 Tax=Rhodoferax sp. TaxID=50421 RepID=UPI001ECD233E|nr:hypothetical protein [Rhodoferax sp.]MBT9505509.1 hypothetical protein [Rhodoferax sp.]